MLSGSPLLNRGLRRVLPACLAASLAACGSDRGADPGADAATPAPKSALPIPQAIATPEPALGRPELLLAVARAASAFATGFDDAEAQAPLDGRRFAFKIRFGCEGPAERLSADAMGWKLDETAGRLTVRAQPDLSADDLGIGGDADGGEKEASSADAGNAQAPAAPAAPVIEAVEGFWIPRPWLLTDACPVVARATAPAGAEDGGGTTDEAPKLGIAHVFTDRDSRVGRRSGRSYQTVKNVAVGETPPAAGFNLLFEGRLRPWPGGKVIRCDAPGPDVRPRCVLSAEFDRVAVENPQTGAELANWSSG